MHNFNNAQNPLHTFPLAILLPICWQQVVVMKFGKRHDTTDITDFCPRQLVTNLLWTCHLRCGLVSNTTWKSPCYGETGHWP